MLVRVFAEFDAEASVWVAQSDDVPLVTEADTVEALRAKLPDIVRDVLEANEIKANMVEIEFTAHSLDRVPVAA